MQLAHQYAAPVAILQGGLGGGQGPPNHSQCPSKIITNISSTLILSAD